MQYTHLGRSGVAVSRLCLGTMNFGGLADEQESFAIMDRALELGINFFDTADVYGNPQRHGLTEALIGRWLAQGGGRRERIVLATKLFSPIGPEINDRGLSAYHIRRACEGSLRRLQTDHIDLYQMHHIDRGRPTTSQLDWLGAERELVFPAHLDPAPPWAEIWQGMEQAMREGKITYVGSSNFAGWNIAQANERAHGRGLIGLVSEQSVYSLAKRTVELEVIPACRAYGVGLLPWSPLAGGLLAGGLAQAEAGSRRARKTLSPDQQARVDQYEALCRDLDAEPAVVALAWLLHNPVVTAPVIGPRTVAQLEGAVQALSVKLDGETLDRLDKIWPGPGGQAPEAYAW
jgi:aryl-alcohol dehydrogenase-like predicted oxidoreductase